MNTLAVEIRIPEALTVALTDDTLHVDLSDGRSLSVPIAWFPRLLHSSEQERNNWRLIGKGHGIHSILINDRSAARPFLSKMINVPLAKWDLRHAQDKPFDMLRIKCSGHRPFTSETNKGHQNS